ncbi:MAG: hypothetical protein WDM86_20620 [Rhizomicrobium sp.]
MFLYRVKVEELDASRLLSLRDGLARGEPVLRAQCPIREMSVVSEDGEAALDIYLALDDFIGVAQLKKLVSQLNAMLDMWPNRTKPRVSSELIHI